MKQHIDMLVALVVSFLLYTRPAVLVAFSQTFVGRAVLLLTMVGALLHSTIAGILVAILIVVFGQKVYGMEGFTANQRRSEEAREICAGITPLRAPACSGSTAPSAGCPRPGDSGHGRH